MSFRLGLSLVAVISCMGCKSSDVTIEDKRPIEVKESTIVNILPTGGEALRTSQGKARWTVEEFRNYWRTNSDPEQSKEILMNIDYLARTDFNWNEFTTDFTFDNSLRPSLKRLEVWSMLVTVIRDKYEANQVQAHEWRTFLFRSPRPLGMTALFQSRLVDQVPFTESEWASILEIMWKRELLRKRSLGVSPWRNLLKVFFVEQQSVGIWKPFIDDSNLWSKVFLQFPDSLGELTETRQRVLESL